MSYFSLAVALAMALLIGSPSGAQTLDPSLAATDSQSALQAQKLLQRAVHAYQANGDQALAAFSRVGEFIDGAYYVYVINLKGSMLASGGSSSPDWARRFGHGGCDWQALFQGDDPGRPGYRQRPD
ncbi:MAG: hypothetical protein HXX19_01450 [Rhodoferax sp.]|nr:hypothetical protein [Rhodoferax sp.]